MQIILTEEELQQAVINHVEQMLSVEPGARPTVDFKAGRGENGITTTVDLTLQTPSREYFATQQEEEASYSHPLQQMVESYFNQLNTSDATVVVDEDGEVDIRAFSDEQSEPEQSPDQEDEDQSESEMDPDETSESEQSEEASEEASEQDQPVEQPQEQPKATPKLNPFRRVVTPDAAPPASGGGNITDNPDNRGGGDTSDETEENSDPEGNKEHEDTQDSENEAPKPKFGKTSVFSRRNRTA